MACLELRFVQERGEDGQLTYRLDPYGPFRSLQYPSDKHYLIGRLMYLSLMIRNGRPILLFRDTQFVALLQKRY